MKGIPKKYLAEGFNVDGPLVFYHGKGCARCGDKGYAGRSVVAELYQYTDTAKKIMEKGFPKEEARVEFNRQELLTIRQDAILKAIDGITTLEEVFRLSQVTQEDD